MIAPLEKQIQKAYRKLICPECKKNLPYNLHSKKLKCGHCSSTYQLVNNVPILFAKNFVSERQELLSSSSGKQMVREYMRNNKKNFERMKSFIKIPGLYYVLIDRKKYLQRLAKKGLVISIGGGPIRQLNFININLDLYPNVDIVADAHTLPIKSGSVDGIIIEAVLEHVSNPEKVINEAFRVLKKGGLIYIETPFLQHYHGYPDHFQNFTLTGHDYLLRKFKKIKSGPLVGPFSTVSVFIMNLFEDFNDNKYLRKLIMLIVAYVLYPLRSLDFFMKNKKNNFKLTSTVYFFGQK